MKLSQIPKQSIEAYKTLSINERINWRSNLRLKGFWASIAASSMSFIENVHLHKNLSSTSQPY